MQSRVYDNKADRSAARRVWVCSIALLWSMGFVTDGYAASPDAEWRAETEFYVAGMSNYVKNDGSTVTYETVATTAELKFSSKARPYSAGLFADYRFSTNNRFSDNMSLGGYLEYSLRHWDATSYLFVNKSPGTEDTWFFAGRLRYRVAQKHKLGVMASGSFRYPGSPALALGYFGSISDSLSLNVIVDPGINKGPDLAAQLQLVWQVH